MKKTTLFFVVALAAVIALHAQTVPAGLQYENYRTGIMITGYTGTAATLVIPSSINGRAVTVIGPLAFYNIKTLRSVTIPNGVDYIASQAFQDSGLSGNITFPASLEEIDAAAFARTELTSVTFNNGLKTIGEGAFSGTKLTSVTIPASVTSIRNNAFSNSTVTSAVIPQGTQVAANAFPPNAAITRQGAPAAATPAQAANPLVGTWSRTMGSGANATTMTYVFNADGTGAFIQRSTPRGVESTETDPFKWTVSGDSFITTFDADRVVSTPYSISGNNLTIRGSTVFTRQAAATPAPAPAVNPLVGTWSRTMGTSPNATTMTYVFNADGTGAFIQRSTPRGVVTTTTDAFKWAASGDTVTTTFTDDNRVVSHPYSISGNTLTVSSSAFARQ